MHKDLTFCENCRDDVTYVVKDESIDTTLKGEKYTYQGKTAYCSKCGNEVFAGWIHDYNLKSLYDEYRDRHNIVSQDVICAIPKKYAIGKRPLSLLMGWGELTYTRYCDGSVPSKPYSDAIRRVYDDPEYYLHILEENKDILKSQSTYEKSKKAVENILSSNVCDKRKIDYVVDYLISHCEDMTSLSLQKALYYIQGFYYAFNDTFIFSDDCQAWRYGPVYKDVYLNYKDYEFDSLSKIKENDLDIFSADEKAILDSCCKAYMLLQRWCFN